MRCFFITVSASTSACIYPAFDSALESCWHDAAVALSSYMTGGVPILRNQRLSHLLVSCPERLYMASCRRATPSILKLGSCRRYGFSVSGFTSLLSVTIFTLSSRYSPCGTCLVGLQPVRDRSRKIDSNATDRPNV